MRLFVGKILLKCLQSFSLWACICSKGEQLATYSYTLNCLEFIFSEEGPKLARRDQFWLSKLVRPYRFFRYRTESASKETVIELGDTVCELGLEERIVMRYLGNGKTMRPLRIAIWYHWQPFMPITVHVAVNQLASHSQLDLYLQSFRPR